MQRRRSALPVLLALSLLAAGCGGNAAPPKASAPAAPAAQPSSAAQPSPAASTAKAPLKVTLRLPYLFSGYDIPFVVARAKGYYRAAGFDVTIGEGKGSATTVETVANGSDAFGVADAGTAALLASKGAPVKMLAVYLQTNPASFFYVPSRLKLTSPAVLRGKTILTFAGDANYQLLPAVLAKYGLKLSDVHVDFVSPAAEGTTFARHPGDVLLGLSTFYPNFARAVPGIAFAPYARFGVNTYSIGLLTDLARIRDHPGQVRRFVAASERGWAYAVAHPGEAVDLALRAFPKQDRALLSGSFAQAVKLLHTPNTQGRPLGWMSSRDWTETLDILQRFGGLRQPKAPSDYYTNAFLPGGKPPAGKP
jgi:NitT/TauT family transport system substrate-binding protein